MRKIGWLMAALMVLALPLAGAAQSSGGRIAGVVTDATGGVLPGVTVNAHGPATVLKTTVTDSNGKYSFESLAPGAWTVSFELPGFATQSSAVTVAAGQATTVDVKLALGARTEAVQVTGTLIPRPTLEAMSPVTTLEVEELTYRGITRVEDLLTSLPQVFVSGQNSNVSNGSAGTASIDLRQLGTVRTLTLIDGRRMSQGDASVTGADLNFIPSALVKRVDVLTGGASATYGADAVAGVVNFVIDRDFVGFKGGIEYSGYQHNNSNALADSINAAKGFPIIKGSRWNDGPINFNVAWGGKFADNKGHASFYLDYRKTNAINKDQRDYTNCSVLGGMTMNGPTCGGSATWPYGRFIVTRNPGTSGVGGDYVLDPTTGALRARTSADVYNYAPKNFMQRPDVRWTGGAFINYDMNKYITLYGDVMFMDDKSDAQIAESGDFGSTTRVNCNNPLLTPAEVAAFCTNAGYGPNDVATVIVQRRNVEGGGRVGHTSHTDLRYSAGVRGTLNNVWSYDVYGLQATVEAPYGFSNDLNKLRLQNALLVTGTAANPVCTTDTANGCVPWNIWVPNGVTPAALAYLSLNEWRDTGLRTRVFNATMKGDLKDYGIISPMATTGVKVAVGTEYRQEYLFVHSDYPFEAFLGAGAGGPIGSVEGTYNVKEFFAEALIPLVQDKEMMKDLSAEIGIRESNYSSTGTHATYKLSLSYAPVADFKFRVGYNRATRSPNIQELFAPQAVNLGGAGDLCAGATPSATQAQCVLMGVPANVYGTVLPNPANQYNTLGGGNPDLQPEVAKTWSAGAVFTPSKFLPGFSATLDYYDIKIDGTIGTLNSSDIQHACANTGELCDLIHRDAFYTTWLQPDGYVITTNQNVGQRAVRGLDVTGSYTRPLPHDLGAFSVNLIGSYLMRQYTNTGIYDYDCVGYFGNTCGNPAPVWRHLARFSWETPWSFTVTAGWRMLGHVLIDEASPNPALGLPENDELNKANNLYEIPAMHYLDLGVTWKARKYMTFIAGVNNVFDKEPPLAPGQSFNDYATGFFGTYDPLGRFIHFGVQFTF